MQIAHDDAERIAALLNSRNQLTVLYTRERVLEAAEDYLVERSGDGAIVGCVQVKRVQWYQSEVLHLTVEAGQERKGHAKALLLQAEELAAQRGARVLQCTIREGNAASQGLFLSHGFSLTCTFSNTMSGNNVAVYQKALVAPR